MAIEKQMPLVSEEEELEIEIPDNSPVIPDGIEIEGLEEAVLEIVPDQGGAFYENLAEVIDERDLRNIALELIGEFEEDETSREDWLEAFTKGLDLLGLKSEERSEPFAGASGVTHPLLSESVAQFQAQAYKEMLPSDGPVKTQIVGDQTEEKVQQAERVRAFMNYQLTYNMEEYDPELDQMLFYLPLSGSAFKKVYYNPAKAEPLAVL